MRLDPNTVRNDLLLRVAKGTQFTCFTVRNVQILTLRGQQCVRLAMQASPLDTTPPLRLTWRRGCSRYSVYLLYEYTKVQILTPEELLESAVEQAMSEMEERWLWCGEEEDVIVCEMVDVLYEELLADTALSFVEPVEPKALGTHVTCVRRDVKAHM